MDERENFCNNVAIVLTSWLKDAKVSPIVPRLHYYKCEHMNGSDLSLLEELGIEVPKLEEKHWVEGTGVFDFFISKESYLKICDRIEKEKANGKRISDL